jgi:hypothetical protein
MERQAIRPSRGGVMTKNEAGELSCRVISIYAFLCALVAFQFPISFLQRGMPQSSTFLTILRFIPAIALLLFSGFLWYGAEFLMTRKDSEAENAERPSGMDPQVLQNMAFSVLGLIILIDTLPYLGQIVVQSLIGRPTQNPQLWVSIGTFIARLAVGFWLLLGSTTLQKLKSFLIEKAKSSKDW